MALGARGGAVIRLAIAPVHGVAAVHGVSAIHWVAPVSEVAPVHGGAAIYRISAVWGLDAPAASILADHAGSLALLISLVEAQIA